MDKLDKYKKGNACGIILHFIKNDDVYDDDAKQK